jgi:parallel beta-helix repeat protein
MPRRTCALVSIAFALFLFAATGAATTAQRTFVASYGNDANPCSIAAPCRGFTRAIKQSSASGEVIVLDSAGYGVVTITKAVSIIAPAGIYAGISVFSGDGVTVNAPGAVVVLRGLSINGQGGTFGIHLLDAARVRIESCVISNMSGSGIHLVSSGTETIVLDTIVRDNGFGIVVLRTGAVVLDHVRSEHNAAQGLSISAPPSSPTLKAAVSNSLFAGNGLDGISVTPSGNTDATIQVERSVISNNGGNGFVAMATLLNTVVGVTLTRNAIGQNMGHGVLISVSGARAVGNLSENALENNAGDGIHVSGLGATIYASANTGNGIVTGQYDFQCDNDGGIVSFGNNYVLDPGPNICRFMMPGS